MNIITSKYSLEHEKEKYKELLYDLVMEMLENRVDEFDRIRLRIEFDIISKFK